MTTKWTQNQALSGDQQEIFDYQTQRNADMAYMAAGKGKQIQQEMSQPLNWKQFGEGQAGPDATTGSAPLTAARSSNVGANLQATTGSAPLTAARSSNVGTNLQATTGSAPFAAARSSNVGANVRNTISDGDFTWDSQNRQRAEDDAYRRSTQRLDTQFDSARTKLERQMSERGLRVGDSAYDSAMNNFSTGRNDAYEMARMQATAEGRQEDQQSYGQAQGAYGMNRQTEQQRYDQDMGIAQNARSADQQRFDQQSNQFGINRQAEQQRFGQNANVAQNMRDADQQRFDQQSNQFGMNRQAEQQRFGQNANVAQNMRDADQQRFDQQSNQFGINRQAEQQRYDQQAQSTDRANALRDQQISEYLSKRGQSLKEANALSGSMNTAEMSSTYGGGGE